MCARSQFPLKSSSVGPTEAEESIWDGCSSARKCSETPAAALELKAALSRLADQAVERRLEALEAKIAPRASVVSVRKNVRNFRDLSEKRAAAEALRATCELTNLAFPMLSNTIARFTLAPLELARRRLQIGDRQTIAKPPGIQ